MNVVEKYLENRGLNLNEHGKSRLAMNYIPTIRKLWSNVGSPKCDFDLKPIEPRKLLKQSKVIVKRVSFETLKKIQKINVNRVVKGHININSIRNKVDMSSSMVKDNIEILMVLETK